MLLSIRENGFMDNEKFQDLVLKKLDLLDTMQADITNLPIYRKNMRPLKRMMHSPLRA